MACIDNIVSLGMCSDEVSLSGLTLMSMEGMSPLNGEMTATEQYGNGITMFNTKKANAIKFFRNDFVGVLQANNIATTITEKQYDSSFFDTASETGTYAGYRGQLVRSKIQQGGLRKLKTTHVQCYPLNSGVGQIVIKDYVSGVEVETAFSVNFVANQLNTFEIEYTAINHSILVLTDQTTFNFAASTIICQDGCEGRKKNPCGTVSGYNGTDLSRSNGFGLNIQYSCECDYDQLICNFSRSFTGELIALKWQELVFRELYSSNRWNAWTIYDREDIWNNIIPDITRRYQTKYENMIQGGMFEMLKQYQDECLNCRGIVVMTNI